MARDPGPTERYDGAVSFASSARARLRLVAVLSCALATWQVAAVAAVGAMTPRPRSCVVPMPCCERGFCPLHKHGASHHGPSHHGGPRWLRCDDDAPPMRLPATGPLAVFVGADALAAPPRFSQRVAAAVDGAPPSRAPEPELHPPEAPPAS